ncbi:GntP family permease [Gilliamella sp. Pra-s65]|uniref:GntP family permease n=1 Tax=unclassified Gilliamella TaxID=2685620 RepID=UPI001321B75E|nr:MULTISPECIES: GntP family permease [unclassified Gilliamella]MWN30945.1 GntP family permease [Gilliamella sp. Pra-s60]MWN89774.1 GntP family permease [Gilliamella sp. Pra-s65]MWP28490.1 GntP family permease [Gilliamella sp. Pra-s54]MWP46922.1 GntP family permease [Gilliamella sp. Pas-s27]MWP72946.1 GntP family permease [Gilliamella sp. Pra-s52]
MNEIISWYGALIGLFLAIFLILRGINPVYSLFFGAIIGAFIGGANLIQTVSILVSGTQSIMGTVIRVLAAGILAGVMMESGAAETIAQAVVKKLGEKKALLALALATGIITASGVFIPVAVLIVAPIALSVGNKMGISRLALLLALSGGGKAGNIISPNPNTIAAANGFNLSLSDVMIGGFIPAIFGLTATVVIASLIKNKGDKIVEQEVLALKKDEPENKSNTPSLIKAIVAPVTAIILLMISPIGNICHIDFLANLKIDALYVLPIAGMIGMFAMGQHRKIAMYTKSGIDKMTPTVLILIGAGAIAGLIGASNLAGQVIHIIQSMGISGYYLSPISGVLMAAATASTSTGVILATGTFGSTITNMGIPAISAAVMMHTGATVIDSLPQGNYFHVTGNSMNMSIKQRMKLIPYEALVGGTMTIIATLLYGFII